MVGAMLAWRKRSEEEFIIMFITTTYPPIFQHTVATSTMSLRLPPTGYGCFVALVRTLRDGTVTREYLQQGLAELVVAAIPYDEPLVASAHIAYSELDSS